MAYRFVIVQDSTIQAAQKSVLLGNAADYFTAIGFTTSILSWIIVNGVILKTKRFYWLFVPLVYIVITALLMTYFDEYIYDFNKQNGLGKGGFSISFFISATIVLVSMIILEINYFVLKNYLKQKIVFDAIDSKTDTKIIRTNF
ncbi:MAG: hypothetical protein H7068_03630 [Pedobacter sp.]|nr:hypothetical protein [Chitinophagaceae bacterium]